MEHNIFFCKGTEYNIPMLLNKPGTGKIIKGEVWEVDYEKLAHLGRYKIKKLKLKYNFIYVVDVLENHPTLYKRELEYVEMELGTVACWTYTMTTFTESLEGLPFLDEYSSSTCDKGGFDHGYLKAKGDKKLRKSIKGVQ